jgi:uncharacterized OB-fold protein
MPQRVPVKKDLFIEGADGWNLIGNKCKACGQAFFPKAKTICLNCYNQEMEDIQFSRRGKLYSYTTAEVPSDHFAPPYIVGYVILNPKVRIFSQLEVVKDKPFKIGMEMEMVIGKVWEEDGKDVIGYRFKPV